jgi:hypothetical protein
MNENEVLLVKRDICRWNDKNINPYELLIVRCDNCREHGEGTRVELQDLGWRTAELEQVSMPDQFVLCPQCQKNDYDWEDLY